MSYEDRETIIFPINDQNILITSHHLTNDFLIYSTDIGNIVYFHVEEWSVACEHKHTVGITDIYADPAGTRIVFIDIKSQGYVYNAVSKCDDVIAAILYLHFTK